MVGAPCPKYEGGGTVPGVPVPPCRGSFLLRPKVKEPLPKSPRRDFRPQMYNAIAAMRAMAAAPMIIPAISPGERPLRDDDEDVIAVLALLAAVVVGVGVTVTVEGAAVLEPVLVEVEECELLISLGFGSSSGHLSPWTVSQLTFRLESTIIVSMTYLAAVHTRLSSPSAYGLPDWYSQSG